jgi:NAD-dependent SIR2 family protein deacetylase
MTDPRITDTQSDAQALVDTLDRVVRQFVDALPSERRGLHLAACVVSYGLGIFAGAGVDRETVTAGTLQAIEQIFGSYESWVCNRCKTPVPPHVVDARASSGMTTRCPLCGSEDGFARATKEPTS